MSSPVFRIFTYLLVIYPISLYIWWLTFASRIIDFAVYVLAILTAYMIGLVFVYRIYHLLTVSIITVRDSLIVILRPLRNFFSFYYWGFHEFYTYSLIQIPDYEFTVFWNAEINIPIFFFLFLNPSVHKRLRKSAEVSASSSSKNART